MLGFVILCLFALVGFAQEGPIQRASLNQAEIDRIIKRLTKNEDDFRFALSNYVFNRSATIQTVGLGGLITGTYRRDSFMTFTKEGKRFEKITYHPVSTIRSMRITPADIEDLGGVNPFAINPSEVSNYSFSYIGKQRIDELNLHVFDVRPRTLPKFSKTKKRFFRGRIWVDDEDFMIVKSKGKGVPEDKNNKFPIVETWRINVDGKYWFPAYSYANDELVFGSGQVVKMKMKVLYENYKQGRSEVIILDDDSEDVVDEEPKEEKPPK